MQRRLVVSYRCFETAHRKYQSTPCNIPEEVNLSYTAEEAFNHVCWFSLATVPNITTLQSYLTTARAYNIIPF